MAFIASECDQPAVRHQADILGTSTPRLRPHASQWHTFSPDEKYLYVNNSEPKKIWMRYRVQPDGSLTEAKLFYDATSDQRPGAPDGMKVDQQGNVYSTGPGGVWIFTPEGKPLGIILMPEKSQQTSPGADADRRTLYITASSSVYRVHLNIPGAPLVRGK